MATIAEHIPALADAVATRDPSIFAPFRRFFAEVRTSLRRIVPADVNVAEVADLTVFTRLRMFLWLSTGLFSAGSFSISAIGYMAFGTVESAATNFLAAIVSACLFGFTSILHFGPDDA